MPSMKSIQFPGSKVVYEIMDAAARSDIAALRQQLNNIVDATLSTAGKAADAAATKAAINAALDEANGVVEEMGLVVQDGLLCFRY